MDSNVIFKNKCVNQNNIESVGIRIVNNPAICTRRYTYVVGHKCHTVVSEILFFSPEETNFI